MGEATDTGVAKVTMFIEVEHSSRSSGSADAGVAKDQIGMEMGGGGGTLLPLLPMPGDAANATDHPATHWLATDCGASQARHRKQMV